MSINKNSKNKKGANLTAYVVLLIALILVALTLGIISCQVEEKYGLCDDTQSTGLVYDPNATEGGWNETDTDKIIDSLNQKVEEGMINISMNTSPNFLNGTSAGNLMIVNESINRYPQVVEITRNDTGELIYKSGAIAVGSKIENAKLAVDLDAGIYECTAMFYNVDPTTGDYLGCAGSIIKINVIQ